MRQHRFVISCCPSPLKPYADSTPAFLLRWYDDGPETPLENYLAMFRACAVSGRMGGLFFDDGCRLDALEEGAQPLIGMPALHPVWVEVRQCQG